MPELYKGYPSKLSETIKIHWISDINELPRREAAHFFLANEFFDALPIQKFEVVDKFDLKKLKVQSLKIFLSRKLQRDIGKF